MKKTLTILLVLLSLISILTACGKEVSRAEKAKAKALEVCENYLDFDITASEAKKQLEDIETALGDKMDEGIVGMHIRALVYDLTKGDTTAFEKDYQSLKSLNLSIYE